MEGFEDVPDGVILELQFISDFLESQPVDLLEIDDFDPLLLRNASVYLVNSGLGSPSSGCHHTSNNDRVINLN